ncbi:hypothetical protein [Winogradskyella sediminis]|uniref:Uncharacterized protein n=1 Tax=Winogradskyella sediminis TaxID=1382466 RepID=A0A1H1PLH7_9FLAO|nr:hypothetical protein [Winogradskyella sediminis]SDS12088.1 hypothetical protein SAMN04489797_0913 [Winogradskyella sediminis]
MKKVVFIMCCIFSTTLLAQQTFFETLESHGENAQYQRYGDIYKTDKGKNAATSSAGKVEVEIHFVDAIYAGITTQYIYKNKPTLIDNFDGATNSVVKQIGFPNTSVLVNEAKNSGYVAMDNYLFFIEGFSEDYTDFRKIARFYILDGSAKKDKPKGKKKGKFWKQLKSSVVYQTNENINQGTGPEYEEAMARDLTNEVKAYLKQMKAKQNTYTLTASDKADLELLKQTVADYGVYVRKKNKEFWDTPEGKEMMRNNKYARLATKRHLENCRLSKTACDDPLHD